MKTEYTELEDSDAVVTVLGYFNYSQNQATEDAGLIVGMIEFATELAYLNYSLCLTTKDARYIVGLNGLRNTTFVTVPAYSSYFQLQTTVDAESTERYCMLVMIIVVKPTYLSYLQIQSNEDAGPNTRYLEWPSTRGTKSETLINGSVKTGETKKINETQAGSEFVF